MSRRLFKFALFSLAWVSVWWTIAWWQHQPVTISPRLPMRWGENSHFQIPEGENSLLVASETFRSGGEMTLFRIVDRVTGVVRSERDFCEFQGFIPAHRLVLLATSKTTDQVLTMAAEFVDVDSGKTVLAVPLKTDDEIWLRPDPPGFFRQTDNETGGLTIEVFDLKSRAFQFVATNLITDRVGGSPDGRTWHHIQFSRSNESWLYRLTFRDAQSGETLGTVPTSISGVKYSSDGRRAFWRHPEVGFSGCELRPFRMLESTETAIADSVAGRVPPLQHVDLDAVISPGGHWLMHQGDFYEVDTGRLIQNARQTTNLNEFHFSTDERHALILGDNQLRFFDLKEGKSVCSWNCSTRNVGLAETVAGPQVFATVDTKRSAFFTSVLERLPKSLSDQIHLWMHERTDCLDAQTGRTIDRFPGLFMFVAHDGSLLVTVRGNEWLLWNLGRWRPRFWTIMLFTFLGPVVAAVWMWRLAPGATEPVDRNAVNHF